MNICTFMSVRLWVYAYVFCTFMSVIKESDYQALFSLPEQWILSLPGAVLYYMRDNICKDYWEFVGLAVRTSLCGEN